MHIMHSTLLSRSSSTTSYLGTRVLLGEYVYYEPYFLIMHNVWIHTPSYYMLAKFYLE